MFDILTLILARGGSKGIHKKNVKPVNGKPLIVYTIEHSLKAVSVIRTIVSTDDDEIAEVSSNCGAEIIWRPAELSGDTASSESALLHALDHLKENENYEPDLVVFLQCTSPIRQLDDIDQAIATLREQDADSLVSGVPVVSWLWRVEDGRPVSFNYDYQNRPRRQDRPLEYNENGSIYIFKPWVLRKLNNRLGGKIALYEMDPWSNIDIETLEDLALAEWVLSQKQHTE